MKWFSFIVAVLIACVPVEAGNRCKSSASCKSNSKRTKSVATAVHRDEFSVTRTRSQSSTRLRTGNLQEWAETEARLMSERGTCGHVQAPPPGVFVGVGCGTTCQHAGQPIAEATVNGKTVRVWAN